MILDLDFIKPFKGTTRAHNLRFLSPSYGWGGTSTPNTQRVLTIEEGVPIRIIEGLQRFNGCSRAFKSPTIVLKIVLSTSKKLSVMPATKNILQGEASPSL